MYKALLGMLACTVLLGFFGFYILKPLVDATLADPNVAKSPVGPIIRLLPFLVVGIPALIAYFMIKGR